MQNKQYITKALAINEYRYAQMVECSAYVWLTRLTDDSAVIGEIVKCSIFWKWWINQWEIRDEQYVYECNIKLINEELSGRTLLLARELYNEKHDPMSLKIIPNSLVVNEIKKIVKNELKKETVKNVIRS